MTSGLVDPTSPPPPHTLSPLQHKVWIKPNAEQSFLYGNHIMKAGLGRMTESTPKYVWDAEGLAEGLAVPRCA